jgi:hypothetical protein
VSGRTEKIIAIKWIGRRHGFPPNAAKLKSWREFAKAFKLVKGLKQEERQ